METRKKISVIVPCFNEEEGLPTFNKELIRVLPETYFHEIIYVNDGSSDNTFRVILALAKENPTIKYISFSRNFGHQNALKAGYDFASGDCAISLDADLQHPPDVIPALISKWEEGFEIVNTIRNDHASIAYTKKISSGIFYKIMRKLSDVNIENGMADFRLIDKKVLKQLKLFNENFLFFRGLIPWMGFSQTNVEFTAAERFAGTTKYTLKKMLKFATTGVTAFSVKPLRLSIYFGSVIAVLSFIYGLYAAYIHIFTDLAITGWTSVILSVLFVGGINLLMLGIIGEYLGKLFIENKRRPNYLISETNLFEN
ncbi:MAG: glycosyl transferase family 2 [Bacteroidetes bacterium GWB2_41_8]|nr:MAG: glycosyl transferase family 2 [Bacteroidetes bacterium GWB2_41_8]